MNSHSCRVSPAKNNGLLAAFRMRSLGCSPCTGAIRSDADTVFKIIEELMGMRNSERANRIIDHDQDGSMEIKKREGYF